MSARPLLLAGALAACSLVLHAQSTASIYAIKGARIVTVSTATIDAGTIVLRNGVVEAVGASVAVPPDAAVVDGQGLTVYPGLIDMGNTAVVESPTVQPLQNARTTAQVERWKQLQLLRPQARAADIVKVDDPDMTRLAAAGITSVLALPPGEVISGQSALVNVAAPPDAPQIGNIPGQRRGLVIVKTPVALHVSFPARPRVGTNAFPVSLMGVIALVRQAFADAQHYSAELAHHEAVEDPVMAAMQPAVTGTLPVAFEANEEREINRALALAREMHLIPIITGGREAASVAAELKAQQARVLFSLNFPQRSRSLAPDADEPLRALEDRANAPKEPAALAKARVPFAFASSGLADPKDFVKNAAKASSEGLGAEATIRALTLDAAIIAGVGDRLGSLDPGKVANVIVTDGDLLDEKTKVVRVFVSGRQIALETAADPRRPPAR